MSVTKAGTVIVVFTLSFSVPLTFSFWRRYVLPLESTTCQCGSGASGTLKSADKVRIFLLSWTVCLTVPVLAFGPLNWLLVWVSSAHKLVTASIANPATAAMSFNFMFVYSSFGVVNLFLFCAWLV